MTSFVVSSSDYAQANDNVDHHSREYVESVKPGDKEIYIDSDGCKRLIEMFDSSGAFSVLHLN